MKKGFTLLETIMVLAIMTMFFAVSIPLFSKFTERTKLDTTARSIVSALRTARTYAITNNKEYYVIFDKQTDPARHSYFISEDGTNPKEKREKLPVGISLGDLPGGSGVTIYNAGFKATGEFDGNDTSFSIKDAENNTKLISVEKTTGRARID